MSLIIPPSVVTLSQIYVAVLICKVCDLLCTDCILQNDLNELNFKYGNSVDFWQFFLFTVKEIFSITITFLES